MPIKAADIMLNVLDKIDSTNNYAMQKVYAGLASDGDAYFTSNQLSGKGQRGKLWLSEPGKNIALSIVIKPMGLGISSQFYLSAAVALGAFDFFCNYAGDETAIKWANDIYWRDRKAGGILIENVLTGSEWKWAIAGIGLNINQTCFGKTLNNPVSLKQVTGRDYDVTQLAGELYHSVMHRINELHSGSHGRKKIISQYNTHLFKKNETVRLKKGNIAFETKICKVLSNGQLITKDTLERHFEFGEVEWVL